MPSLKVKKNCLTIAGSDCSGGAGIQADIKSMSANNTFAMSVITVVTSQNSYKIDAIFPIPLDVIRKQIDILFEDYIIDSVKIGALFNKKIIELVSKKMHQYKPKHLIIDPVMISKAGELLMEPKDASFFIDAFKNITTLITPNITEAEFIINKKINSLEEMKNAAIEINKLGFQNVLLKGGHLESEILTDILYSKNKFYEYKNKKITTKNTHGTGCTLSSAIAANLANNMGIENAINKAIKYTNMAIKHNLDIGKGCGPLDHF